MWCVLLQFVVALCFKNIGEIDRMPRGNPEFAEHGFKKGDGRGGRPKGTPNKTTRALKEAIILAAEKSKHSKAHDLEGYLLYLADEKRLRCRACCVRFH